LIKKNGSGGISDEELKENFRLNKDSPENWKKIVSEVDKNYDG
jgi:hypothetical protein